MARRYKLSEATIKKFCEAIEIGATIGIAARYADVADATVFGWMKQGRKLLTKIEAAEEESEEGFDFETLTEIDRLYLKLMDSYEKARSTLGIEALTVVYSASQTDPNWAWRLLQTKWPEAFAGKPSVAITPAGGGGDGDNAGDELVIRIQYVQPESPVKIEDTAAPGQGDGIPALELEPLDKDGPDGAEDH